MRASTIATLAAVTLISAAPHPAAGGAAGTDEVLWARVTLLVEPSQPSPDTVDASVVPGGLYTLGEVQSRGWPAVDAEVEGRVQRLATWLADVEGSMRLGTLVVRRFYLPLEPGVVAPLPTVDIAPCVAVSLRLDALHGDRADLDVEVRTGHDAWPEGVSAGEPITLNLRGADIRDVVKTLGELTGLKVVVDPAVSGSVTVEMREVPWRRALDVIVRSAGLGYFLEEGAIHVVRLADRGQDMKLLSRATVTVHRDAETAFFSTPDGSAAGTIAMLIRPLDAPPGEEKSLADPRLRGVGEIRKQLREAAPAEERLVVVRGVVGEDGSFSEVKVLGTPSPQLAEAVRASAASWRFEPALTGEGQPRRVAVGLGLRLDATTVPVPPEHYSFDMKVEPAPKGEGQYVLTAVVSDLDSGEVVSAPRVAFQSGKEASLKSGFVTPDGREHLLEATVTADAAARTAAIWWRVTWAGKVVASLRADLKL